MFMLVIEPPIGGAGIFLEVSWSFGWESQNKA